MQIDHNLIEGCRKKKRSAQNELYKQVFSFLMNICIRYKNDYETAGASLNYIFLKILNNLDEIDDLKAFPAWIKRIAVNQLIDEYRKDKKDREHLIYVEDHRPYNGYGKSEHLGEQKLDSEYLRDLINKLPPLTKSVFNLYVVDGYKHREIAELLDMSENTSKWHLREARIKLKEEIIQIHKLIEQ